MHAPKFRKKVGAQTRFYSSTKAPLDKVWKPLYLLTVFSLIL